MRTLVIVLADAAVWAGWSVIVGYGAHRLPRSFVDHDGWLTRPRRWEQRGRFYERLGIRWWKDRLPEAGGAFRGGTSKRSLPGRADGDLARFAAETRRAELVHWAVPAVTPLFPLWNPPGLVVAMVAYAVLANVPCIAIQRYNRARIARILARRAGAGAAA
jgi:glycosyl-4,4'-diaponeurosporenoate acyltransferase